MRFLNAFFSPRLDLRVRLFNILAIAGILLSLYAGVVMLLGNETMRAAIACSAAVLSALLMWYAGRTGKYERCYVITVAAIFFGLFTALLVTGGADGSLAFLPVLGVLFTVMLLKGKRGLIIAAVELLYYAGLFALVIFHPQWYLTYFDIPALALDMGLGFVVLCGSLMLCVFGMMRLYDRQKERLDEQNHLLAEAGRLKTQFLSNASHEMRTPLTVVSVNVQTVMEILEDMGGAPEAAALLQNAQDDIMRLSRMVGGMLTLASMSENTQRQALDLSALLQSGAEMLRLHLGKRGNTLDTEIQPELRVFGNADLLAQVLTNLLQNAGAHTENGAVTVRAKKTGGEIAVEVRDTGRGISPQLLPHVFERGVSTGGTGLGLYLCKTVVESHGGRIFVESELGKGTAIHFTLATYEGQLEELRV